MAKAKTINIHAAKTQFSKLIRQVERGDEIIIARAGHPVARICALPAATKPKRVPGTGKGFFSMTEDFDAPLPEEIQRLFSGEG